MSKLLAQMIPLGLAAAISPTMLTASIIILSSKDRPKLRTVLFLLGVVVSLIVIGFAAVALGGAATGAHRGPSKTSAGLDAAIGLLLLYVGAKRLIKGPKQQEKPAAKPDQTHSLLSSLGLGVFFAVTDFTSLVFYFAAAKESVDANVGTAGEVLAMSIVAFFIALPVSLPLALTIAMPGTSQRALGSVHEALEKYGKFIMPGIAVLFGIYLLYKGLIVLV